LKAGDGKALMGRSLSSLLDDALQQRSGTLIMNHAAFSIRLRYKTQGVEMGKFDHLFEDEDGLFSGTPQQRYWEIFNQLNPEIGEGAFDEIIERMAVMEKMLMQQYGEEELNAAVRNYAVHNMSEVEAHKTSLYMELAGELIYKLSD
jgi:hypothetical protein